jgi:SNF2 family DNA or RNA helicase
MTGTPVANRPYDMWAQIYFLDHGLSLGDDFNEFKNATDLSNKLAESPELQRHFEDTLSKVFEKIQKFSVRETKNSGIISLPDKVYIRESADFLPRQKDLYDKIREELKVDVIQDGELTEDDSSASVKRLLRLVQVTSNPRLVDESYRGDSAKEAVLDKLLRQIIDAGEKCIVWTRGDYHRGASRSTCGTSYHRNS